MKTLASPDEASRFQASASQLKITQLKSAKYTHGPGNQAGPARTPKPFLQFEENVPSSLSAGRYEGPTLIPIPQK